MTLAFVVRFFSHSSFQKIFFLSVLLFCVRADISHSSLDLWQKSWRNGESGSSIMWSWCLFNLTLSADYANMWKICDCATKNSFGGWWEKRKRKIFRQDILMKSVQRILYLHIKWAFVFILLAHCLISWDGISIEIRRASLRAIVRKAEPDCSQQRRFIVLLNAKKSKETTDHFVLFNDFFYFIAIWGRL